AGAERVDRVDRAALAVLEGRVDALGDVAGLLADRHGHPARVAVETGLARGVPDVVDVTAHDAGDVDVPVSAHFAGHMHQPGRHQCLDGDAAVRVCRQQRVEDAVRDLIADLVGMPLGDGFGR